MAAATPTAMMPANNACLAQQAPERRSPQGPELWGSAEVLVKASVSTGSAFVDPGSALAQEIADLRVSICKHESRGHFPARTMPGPWWGGKDVPFIGTLPGAENVHKKADLRRLQNWFRLLCRSVQIEVTAVPERGSVWFMHLIVSRKRWVIIMACSTLAQERK